MLRRNCDDRRKVEGCNVAGGEDGGRRPPAKECVCPLETGKGEQIAFPIALQKGS